LRRIARPLARKGLSVIAAFLLKISFPLGSRTARCAG